MWCNWILQSSIIESEYFARVPRAHHQVISEIAAARHWQVHRKNIVVHKMMETLAFFSIV